LSELFELVDREGNPVGQATREECHGNPLLIHLVVHLHVLDSTGRLLLQKRARDKDTNPGLWDTSVGGHVRTGEEVRTALLREASEELGIDASSAKPLYGFLYGNSFETEFAWSFSIIFGGPFVPDAGEIEDVRFFSFREIDGMISTGALTPMLEHELPMLRKGLQGSRHEKG